MTQYVQLSADTTKVIAWYAGPQNAADKPGYTTVADTDARYLAYLAATQAAQAAAAAVAAGMQLASASTPALNGTYAIDPASKTNIDGIYSSIKNGDGLPGGGATFNYPDIGGTLHAFNATTFPAFAKAVRDFLYALSQGEAPTQPAPIA